MLSFDLTGEGVAAIIFALGTGATSAYGMYRTIRADRKADERDAIAAAALAEQNKVLSLVAEKQEGTHAALSAVVATVGKMGENVALVEQNTNSLKDALVASTAKASHSEGVLDGVAQEKARATAKPKAGKP